VYRLDDGQNFVSLANTLSAFYETYTDESQFGYVNLTLNAGHYTGPLSFGLSDIFVRSDNTSINQTQPLLLPQQRYITNRATPQMRYEFSPLTIATLSYTNTLVISENVNPATTTTNAVTPGISHWFSPTLSGNMFYTFSTTNQSGTISNGAFIGQTNSIRTSLGYLLDPKTTLIPSAFGAITNQTGPGGRDSYAYGMNIGARRLLSSNVSLYGSIGPMVYKRQGDKQRIRANWQISLDSPIPLTPTLTLALTTQQSLVNTANEVNNQGIVLRSLVNARLIYTPTAFFSGSLFAAYTRTEFLEATNSSGTGTKGAESLVSTGVTASYALTQFISLTGIYRYQRGDPSQPGAYFDENRVTLAVTGTFVAF
jgi:hypothetical protein